MVDKLRPKAPRLSTDGGRTTRSTAGASRKPASGKTSVATAAGPNAPVDVSRSLTLAASLASLGGQRAIGKLRDGLVRALSAEVLVDTNPKTETLAKGAVRDLIAGKLDPEALVAKALKAGGPLRIAELIGALAWRIDAARVALPKNEQDAFAKRSGDAMEAFAAASLAALTSRPPKDARDAVATMIAQSALLSGGQTADSAYFQTGTFEYAAYFDAFTNESKLSAAIDALEPRGGAVVGVSGTALHVAGSVAADTLVVTDLNPEIRDFVTIFSATVLGLVERAGKEGWSDEQLVDEVHRRISSDDRGSSSLVAELRELGVPEAMLARVPKMLKAVWNLSGNDRRNVWFATKSQTLDRAIGTATSTEDAARNLRNLAACAQKGGVASAVVDLSDRAATARVGAFLEARGTPVSILHLSNALDYVADPVAVIDGVTALPRTDATTVVSSTAGSFPDRRVGSWYEPAVLPVEQWVGEGGIRETVAAMPDLDRRKWMQRLMDAGVAYSSVPDVPKTRAKRETAFKRIVDEHFADDARAMVTLVSALGLTSVGRKFDAAVVALTKRRVPMPRSPETVRALVRALNPLLPEIRREVDGSLT